MESKTLEFRLLVKDSVLGLATSIKKFSEKLLILQDQKKKLSKQQITYLLSEIYEQFLIDL